MLVNFFHVLKDTGVPVTPRELLDLLEAMEQRLAFGDMDDFYSLSRAILVKDEKYYDRFDRAFGLHFQDLEALDDVIEAMIPDDWLRSEFMKQLSEEDKAKIESLGGLEELIEQFKERTCLGNYHVGAVLPMFLEAAVDGTISRGAFLKCMGRFKLPDSSTDGDADFGSLSTTDKIINHLYDLFDTNGDGVIDVVELASGHITEYRYVNECRQELHAR